MPATEVVGQGPRRAAGTRRLLSTLLLLHYALATWAIPVAHAALSDHRPLPPLHAERQGNPNCQSVHSHINCPGFGIARLLADAPKPLRLPDGSRAAAVVSLPRLEGRPRQPSVASLGPRGPPRL